MARDGARCREMERDGEIWRVMQRDERDGERCGEVERYRERWREMDRGRER